MLVYLIDGFNLFHRIWSIKNSATPHYDLIQYIRRNRLTGSPNNKAIIVYDGHDSADLGVEKGFKICFSCDKTADEVIKGMIEKSRNKSSLIVVSDDREIRDCAKREGAISCRTRQFLGKKSGGGNKHQHDDKDINCSSMMEITEELGKIWLSER